MHEEEHRFQKVHRQAKATSSLKFARAKSSGEVSCCFLKLLAEGLTLQNSKIDTEGILLNWVK